MSVTLPRYVLVVLLAAVISFSASVGVASWVAQRGRDEQLRDCERAVAVRADGRAMWLYLVDTSPQPDTDAQRARVAAFVAELNKRLPRLECVDGNPVPAKP